MLPNIGVASKIPELRKRLLFTLGLLAIYRFGVFVSTPGIDVAALRKMFEGGAQTIFGLANLFSGGALENFSIFTLGIVPYITVSIIMQLLTPVVPSLERLKKEGEQGQRVLTRYTRQLTVLLALFQSYWISVALEKQGLCMEPGILFRVTTMFSLTAGTAFIMWLAESITERGIGNGSSMIIMAGILARMPAVFFETLLLPSSTGAQPIFILFVFLLAIATVAFVVYVENAQRRIPVQYPRKTTGNMVEARPQYLPFKLNIAGVMPPILASTVMVAPGTIAAFSSNESIQDVVAFLTPGTWGYLVIYAVLNVFFAYFYIGSVIDINQMSDNLKKQGGFIPTIRPGRETVEYLYKILNRLTFWGALYIVIICLFPQWAFLKLGATSFSYVFGGTAVLIVVGVIIDLLSQIESHVVAQNYEAFMNRNAKGAANLGSLKFGRARLLRR